MTGRAAPLLIAGATILLAGCATSPSGPALGFAGARPVKAMTTWKEIREAQVVRQTWDLSCGSAALSTLLTHHLGDPTSEAAVIVWLLRRTDPVKIQSRGGFSLLDLKRFAEARGYKADGYAGLTIPDLIALGPAIVPVHVKGYDHFVVVRGMAGDRIVIADPAFGNSTRRLDRFTEIWSSGIAFVLYPHGQNVQTRHSPLPDHLLVPDAAFAYRQVGAAAAAGPQRRSR